MKELKFENGGRKLFNEDLVDIQDHLISIQKMFVGESPFILSGIVFANYSGNLHSTTEGYVWLDGKIRYVPAQTGLDFTSPLYLNTEDIDESTDFEDGISKISSTNYSVIIESSASGNESIRIDPHEDILRYFKNVLGDKYLQLDSEDIEVINSSLRFESPITVNGAVQVNNTVSAEEVVVGGELSVSGGDISVEEDVNVGGNILAGSSVRAKDFYINSLSSPVISDLGVIGDNLVENDSIQAGAVTEDKLGNNSVTSSKVANNSITTNSIVDGEVTEDKLANNSVNTDKIVNDSITEDKIGFSSLKILSSGIVSNTSIDGDLTFITVTHNLSLVPNSYFIWVTAKNTDKSICCNTTYNETANSFTILAHAQDSVTPVFADINWQIISTI